MKINVLGKSMAIKRYVKEYSDLISQRQELLAKKAEIISSLGIELGHTSNLDEMAKEADRLEKRMGELEDVYKRGKEDVTQLSDLELLDFQRLQEYNNISQKETHLSIRILAIRQGLMNIADPVKSRLDSGLSEKYIDTEEFISHSSYKSLVDFMKAYNRTSKASVPELDESEVEALVVKCQSLVKYDGEQEQLHPVLKEFVEILREVNMRTGYSEGKNPYIPFNFKEGKLEGEVTVDMENAKNRGVTPKIQEDNER